MKRSENPCFLVQWNLPCWVYQPSLRATRSTIPPSSSRIDIYSAMRHDVNKWYFVKENWPNITDIAASYGGEYIGLGGWGWPGGCEYGQFTLDVFDRIEKARTYLELKTYGGSTIDACVTTDPELAIAFLNSPSIQKRKTILVEIQYAHDVLRANVDGYDFGNPEGGYSIIETEILARNSGETIDKYLNEFCLFNDIDSMHDFLSSLKTAVQRGACEELDDYVPVAIKKLS